MGNVVVGIHQPNFMPWLGYFYKILQSDVFIFLDDVQIQKTGASYTNRVSINQNGFAHNITMPIKKDKNNLAIKYVKYLDEKWKNKLIKTLQTVYAKALFFQKHKEFIFELILFQASNIAQYNIHFIQSIAQCLGINSIFVKSSDFHIESSSTLRLIELVKCVNGNIYLSGNGGDKYQDKDLYMQHNIALQYNKMPNYIYQQYNTESFLGGLSVIDAIFNVGFDGLRKDLFFNEKSS